jgi:hypothetical protein
MLRRVERSAPLKAYLFCAGYRRRRGSFSPEHRKSSWRPDATWFPSDAPVAAKPPLFLSVFLKEADRVLSHGRIRFVMSSIPRKRCLKLARRLLGANTLWGILETH